MIPAPRPPRKRRHFPRASAAAREQPAQADRIGSLAAARAALAAGAAPALALQAAAEGQPRLGAIAAAARLGSPVADLAATVDTADPSLDLLVRALGVAERVGAGGLDAVDQALTAAREEADLHRLLRVRSAQARGTARLLALLPVAGWSLMALADPGVLGYLRTAVGAVTTAGAALLTVAARLWLGRIVDHAGTAAAEADPLRPPRPPWRWGRAAAVAVPAAVLLVATAGIGTATGVSALLLVGTARPARPTAACDAGGSTEAVELLAVALRAGLSPSAAVATVVPLAPKAARGALETAARRLQGGWDPAEALAGSGLDVVGAVLHACGRWGAPTGPALTRLAADLRAERRSAAEEAAERTQLHLVFPTTLLTLPAFLLAVVPPLLWTALAGTPLPMHLP